MRTTLSSLLAVAGLLVVACGPATDTRPPELPALPFIADDYSAALAEARQRKLPLFVESWAPW